MYQEHPRFESPSDQNVTIWRYMDFAKFVSMLHTGHLHFTRLDGFGDPFEGALPKRHVQAVRQARVEHQEKNPELWEHFKNLGQVKSSATEEYQELRTRIAVNCWHKNEQESAAMWSLYLKSENGIAIQSTYKKLAESFNSNDKTVIVWVGMVKYIDYEKEMFEDFNNMLLPALHKRASFQHENELRAVVCGSTPYEGNLHLDMREFPETGVDVAVDLGTLIDSIYVAPGTPEWFKQSVESVAEKYELGVPVKQSSLDDEPLW